VSETTLMVETRGRGPAGAVTAEYRAIFETTAADRAEGGLGGDPTGLCLPHGMPRMMIAVFPIEFIVTPATIYVLTDYTTHRRIFTDGRSWPNEILPSFNGYSIGPMVGYRRRWCLRPARGRNARLQRPAHVRGQRTAAARGWPDVIQGAAVADAANKTFMRNETTVIDHALTRPWTVTRSYRRDRNPVWDFVDCASTTRMCASARNPIW
jgi:hypothetical protein